MSRISKRTCISDSRLILGLDTCVPARIFRVYRLDRADEDYYLVIFGEIQASVGVAAVDIMTGGILIFAKLPGTEEHLSVDSEKALRITNAPEGARARLVWKPFKGSRSPLYPAWEISYNETLTYIDQQGSTWDSLDEMSA